MHCILVTGTAHISIVICVWSANQRRFAQVCVAHLLDFIKTQFLLHKMFQGPSVVHPHWWALFKSKYGEWLDPIADLVMITSIIL
jgi:hypothetical protein